MENTKISVQDLNLHYGDESCVKTCQYGDSGKCDHCIYRSDLDAVNPPF